MFRWAKPSLGHTSNRELPLPVLESVNRPRVWKGLLSTIPDPFDQRLYTGKDAAGRHCLRLPSARCKVRAARRRGYPGDRASSISELAQRSRRGAEIGRMKFGDRKKSATQREQVQQSTGRTRGSYNSSTSCGRSRRSPTVGSHNRKSVFPLMRVNGKNGRERI